ncbi:sensor histidine kinase [Lapidilactobacillus wuchangensis]|uniref:sensor histidine kinase n=1 Tax=Lapidilactobacillus wuchangensis TaxID=2486001 RepID=UPI000F777736|nr:histidine kinase [Lapidilactobacillus wuchangensis]
MQWINNTKISKKFAVLSLKTKLRMLFYGLITIVTILLIGVGSVLVSMVAQETYKSNRDQLAVLSNDIKNSFSRVEELITAFHQDTRLQEQLESVNHAGISQNEKYKTLFNIDREMGWLVASSKVNSWVLFDQNKQVLLGNKEQLDQYIGEYKIKNYLGSIKNDSEEGAWFFDKTSHKAVFVHNLFDTRKLIMRPIGVLVFTVDLNYIDDFMRDSGIFSNEDFLVISNEEQSYSTIPSRLVTAERALQNKSTKDYKFIHIYHHRYYVLSDLITIANRSFVINYFILNRLIIAKIIIVTIILLLIIFLIIVLCIYAANYFLNRLITPINVLADNMQLFSNSKNLDVLHDQIVKLPGVKRRDEIGSLYKSFERLLDEIDRLVIKDYQSQVLTQEMENKYLMAQIDPHFLYNTLNSINWIALNHEDEEVSQVVTSLAFLLREKANPKVQYNSIVDELNIVQAYIKIQSIRFGERLVFKVNLPGSTTLENIQIPKLTIQPIVENAVKYGVEKSDRPVKITIRVRLVKQKLIIKVFNDGEGFDPRNVTSESTGVGIHNISSRLKLLYGDKAGISIQSAPHEVTNVLIWLPIVRKDNSNEQ